MRSYFFLFCVLAVFVSACGSMTNKDSASLSSEPAFLIENSDDLYMIESKDKKKVYFLFFDENEQLISRSKAPFPKGAFEAKVYVDDPAQIVSASFTTCCGKTIEISFTEKDGGGLIYLSEFNLANAKHKLTINFEDNDVAELSQESL